MKKIFISHSWSNSNARSDLLKRLKDYNTYYKDRSITKHIRIDSNKQIVQRVIEKRISESSAVIFLIDHHIFKSYWIEFEYKMARKYEKPILIVKTKGVWRLPAIFTGGECKTASLNYDHIVSELRGLIGI